MNKYIDLLLVQGSDGEKMVIKAPAFSHVKVGEEVTVEGLGIFPVLASFNGADEEAVNFVLAMTGGETFPRAAELVVYRKFEYPEDEE